MSDLTNNKNHQDFVKKYNLEWRFKDVVDIGQEMSNLLNSISELIIKKCAGTYTLYGLEELELGKMPIFPEGLNLNQIQICLYYYYIHATGENLCRPDWIQVANKFGYTSKTSWIKLYQHYCRLHKKVDRINYPSAANNINKVVSCLSGYPKSKVMAENELLEAEEWLRKKAEKRLNK
jgi:hypothetical protein